MPGASVAAGPFIGDLAIADAVGQFAAPPGGAVGPTYASAFGNLAMNSSEATCSTS